MSKWLNIPMRALIDIGAFAAALAEPVWDSLNSHQSLRLPSDPVHPVASGTMNVEGHINDNRC